LSEQKKNEIFHLYERALLIRRKTFGNSSSETSATLNNMGNFMRHTGNFKAAENFFLEALKIHQTYLKHTENDHQARTLINLGRLYRAQKKYEEAIHFFEKAKEIRQKLFPGSKEVGFCLEMIGKCMILDGKHIKKGKILEEKGKKLLKFGLCAEEASTSINSVHHFSLPNSFSSFIWQISIFDFFELKALKSRQFVLPSKIIGEKGIHLKKIEAITHAQLRYIGPWPFEVSNIDNKQDLKNIKVYLNIAATSEKSIEKAKQLAIEHLRKIQIQWENFQASSSYNQRRRDHSNPPSTGSQGTNGHKSSSSSSFSSRLKARNRSVSYRKCHKKIQ
jgi:tetratricopeptide (TPR) repeat protein